MKPFISIISPVRNEDKYISKCLSSMVCQSYPNENYEIIVVDGLSDDGTRKIIERFQQQYKNIKLLDNPSQTVPQALNIGLSHAKGNVIVRVDGHAIIEKDYLSKCVKYLQRTRVECVGGVIESVNETFIGKAIALAMAYPFGVGNAHFRTSGKEGFVDTIAFGAYRREVFDKIGYFDEELVRCQDDEFNYRLRKFGGKIFLTPKIKSYYYPRANLKKLWHQYFSYGLWKIRVLQKHFKRMQLRQFVPPAFVSSLITTGILGIFSNTMLFAFYSVTLMYMVTALFVSFKISIKSEFKYFTVLPIIFPILHVSYGLGFLWGIVKFSKFWMKDKHR